MKIDYEKLNKTVQLGFRLDTIGDQLDSFSWRPEDILSNRCIMIFFNEMNYN
jgi:hypothetical protein